VTSYCHQVRVTTCGSGQRLAAAPTPNTLMEVYRESDPAANQTRSGICLLDMSARGVLPYPAALGSGGA